MNPYTQEARDAISVPEAWYLPPMPLAAWGCLAGMVAIVALYYWLERRSA
ncbi:hypothetical protein C1752_12037 [Acaryochloris thomasi RCC1774]|uniref:Uncharacterized protein n=1 Tax=Acaryochloris thomasi RCC1774 TaxID=1764569 RepID=A0A2W1J8K1_9CYAN|nr:hypothetical protein [Acaryochloris thomasi]PZD70466.1 hypothetical protein C1752_12037 [Acaryochloris thomasi RCC1774]